MTLLLLFSVIDGFEWLWMEKSSQEYPVDAGVRHGSILGRTLFLLYINDDVICNIAIYADNSTLYSKCNQASNL